MHVAFMWGGALTVVVAVVLMEGCGGICTVSREVNLHKHHEGDADRTQTSTRASLMR